MYEIETVVALCEEAAAAARELQALARSTTKSDGSPVSNADMRSNEILTRGLLSSGYPVLSEESESAAVPEKGFAWVIDPLDGTSGFLNGENEWSVMVGLLHDRIPVAGVVCSPLLGKTWYAEKSKGAFLREGGTARRIHVSKEGNARAGTLLLSAHHPSAAATALRTRIGAKTLQISSIGTKVCLIAEGSADMYWTEGQLSVFDTCAPQSILTEAGGMLTDGAGEPIVYDNVDTRVPGVIGSNTLLHEALLAARD
jgi:3'(2'), 5'-bisphosphate nucleotidase